MRPGIDSVEINGMNVRKVFLWLMLAALSAAAMALGERSGREVTIRILWTNDTHAYLRPVYHREEGESGFLQRARREGKVGGFAHLATAIDRLRAEMPKNTLLLDAGDTLHGTAVPLFGKGKPVIQVMNAMGYDAMTLGNVDYLYSREVLEQRAKEAEFPFIAANVYDMEWGDPALKQYLLKVIGGVKVAIVGMTYQWTAKTGDRRLTKGLSFGLREREVKELIAQLRGEEKVDVIVMLSHMGYAVDQKYASRVKGIDAIVGAHTHDIVLDPPVVGGTVVVQAGSHGSYLGRLDLKVKNGKVSGFDHKIQRIVARDIPADPRIAAIIEKSYAPYRAMLERVVGVTKTMLYRRARWQNTMDNFITDAYRELENADVAFAPAWRFGATILPGNIRVEDVYNMVPTDGTIVTYRMPGRVIKTVLESAIDNVLNKDPYLQLGGDMVRFAGMQVRYDAQKPFGARIVSIWIGGRPIEMKKKYAIVSANTQFQNAPGVDEVKDTGKIAVEALIRFIEKISPIAPKLDDRIRKAN